MTYNQRIGSFGENLACKYLSKKGYKIIGRNIKVSYQEIDIIAKIKEKIVFVEVKTRTSNMFGQADEAIYSHKIKNLKKAIGMYIGSKKIDPENINLDFIAIDINKSEKTANISHKKDII